MLGTLLHCVAYNPKIARYAELCKSMSWGHQREGAVKRAGGPDSLNLRRLTIPLCVLV